MSFICYQVKSDLSCSVSYLLYAFLTNSFLINWSRTQTPGISLSHGWALEGAVFTDYFQSACSVLYYSCSRTHAHDPATHLALVSMQPVVSKGLIKQCRGSGPSLSLSTALLFTAPIPKSSHNCLRLLKNSEDLYWLPLGGLLPPGERRAACCQPPSASFLKEPLSPERSKKNVGFQKWHQTTHTLYFAYFIIKTNWQWFQFFVLYY